MRVHSSSETAPVGAQDGRGDEEGEGGLVRLEETARDVVEDDERRVVHDVGEAPCGRSSAGAACCTASRKRLEK